MYSEKAGTCSVEENPSSNFPTPSTHIYTWNFEELNELFNTKRTNVAKVYSYFFKQQQLS